MGIFKGQVAERIVVIQPLILLILACVFSLNIFAQKLQHEALAINIQVPVRVYKGDKFVDNLKIDDFEVYEDGVLQEIEAVYLIRKTKIERKEEKKRFRPKTSRTFYLFFEIADFTPRLEEAIDFFIYNVLTPEDELVVVTPMKTYRMKKESLQLLPKKQIVKQLKSILRKDAWIGSSEYREAVRDLTRIVRLFGPIEGAEGRRILDQYSSIAGASTTGTVDELLTQYALILEKLENLRKVDQRKLLDFAQYLKNKKGQKIVFLFYQREFVPQLRPQLFNKLIALNQDRPDIQLNAMSLFGFFMRDISIDVEAVKQAYSDSSITINFLFFTKPAEHIPGIRMIEHSEDIFGAFNEMAQATGGITASSANPEFLFKKAGEATENYYLLYYTPKNYKADGKFRKIEVKVKGRNYRITHRAGYFAD